MIPRRYPKLKKRVDPLHVELHVQCGRCCKSDVILWADISFKIGGGCGGHGPAEYCYCEGANYTATFMCVNCKNVNYLAFEEEQ